MKIKIYIGKESFQVTDSISMGNIDYFKGIQVCDLTKAQHHRELHEGKKQWKAVYKLL